MIFTSHLRRPFGRFFCLLISLLLAAGLARAQAPVAVSGNVRDLTGTAAAKTKVRLHLANCSGIPRVLGTGIVARDSYEFTPDSSGNFSGSVYPNSAIDCGGAATSTYKVMVHVDGALRWQAEFLISAATDLNTAAPVTTAPPPAPAAAYLRANPAGSQTILQPPGTALVITGGEGLKAQRLNNVRMADQFAGDDAGARLIAAIADLPATGGTVDARGFEGQQSINSTIDITKPVTLLLGAADFFCSADPCFRVTDDLVMRGINRRATSVHSADDGVVFAGGGTVEVFHLENILFRGHNNTAVLLDAPAYQAGVNDWDTARITIDNCVIASFLGKAIKIGQSVQFFDIRRNFFEYNAGHLDIGWASDGELSENEFFRGLGDQPQVRVAGGSIVKVVRNVFLKSSGSTPAADIEINSCNPAGASGFVWIAQNKFGPEGETASRPKIRTYCASSSSAYSRNVYVVDNFFGGNSTTYAIQLDNPIDRWMLAGNFFSGYTAALVNDAFTPPNVNIGASVFTRTNRVLPIGGTSATAMPREFVNGGRGFLLIEPVTFGVQQTADITPRGNETAGLRNRIAYSEDLGNAAWSKTGVTVTAGQADPFGGTRATLLTREGSAAGERAQINLDTTTDSPPRLVVKLWAKAGTLQQLQPAVRDVTNSRIVHHAPLLTLDATWRQYKFVVEGITPGGNPAYALTLYPGNFVQAQAGTVHVFGVQVSDLDSDYLPASGAAAGSPAGNRYERRAIFANATPFEVAANSAKVANLDADKLDGADWASPPPIGSGTPNSATFSSLTVTGATWVPNLNVDFLDGRHAASLAPDVATPDAGYFFGGVVTLPTNIVAAAAVVSNNQVRVVQFVLPFRTTVRRISIEISTSANGSTTDAGLYDASGSRVVNAGGFDSGSTGVKTVTLGAPVTLDPGVYYFAWTASSNNVQARLANNPAGQANLMNAVAVKKQGTASNNATSGVLPATLGAINALSVAPLLAIFEP